MTRRGRQPLLVLALAATAWAAPAGALDLNGIKVTPSVTYRGEYDDNVFRTQFDKRSDYANIVRPGITVEATPGRHEIRAAYLAEIIRYVNHTTNDSDRHTASLIGNFNFTRFATRFREEFRRTDDFPTTELTRRIKRNENVLGGGLDYDVFGRWGLGFDVTWENFNYLRSDFDFLDRNTYTYATNLYYRITAKTRAFGEYDFVREIYESDKTRDTNRHRGLLGVRGDLTERLSLTAKGGYERILFQSSERSGQDQENVVVSLEGNYRPVERLGIGLILTRRFEPSTFANNAQFGTSMATLILTYAFTSKITVIPRGFFGVDNYRQSSLNIDRQEKRLDYNYGGGLTVQYRLQKWIRLEGSYDFSRRDSNFNSNDYDDNRVSFAVTLSL